MKDTVYRQAAIDALCDNCDHVEAVCPHYPCKQYIVIENLPSAQQEIIRCKDFEWFRKEYGWNCIEYTVCGISPTYHPIRREEDFCSYAERKEGWTI